MEIFDFALHSSEQFMLGHTRIWLCVCVCCVFFFFSLRLRSLRLPFVRPKRTRAVYECDDAKIGLRVRTRAGSGGN